jgi:hypothetical protein
MAHASPSAFPAGETFFVWQNDGCKIGEPKRSFKKLVVFGGGMLFEELIKSLVFDDKVAGEFDAQRISLQF